MILKDKQGLEVEVQVSGSSQDEVYIETAQYIDSDLEVPDETIQWLEEMYAEEIYDTWYQMMVCMAEYAYEGDR